MPKLITSLAPMLAAPAAWLVAVCVLGVAPVSVPALAILCVAGGIAASWTICLSK